MFKAGTSDEITAGAQTRGLHKSLA